MMKNKIETQILQSHEIIGILITPILFLNLAACGTMDLSPSKNANDQILKEQAQEKVIAITSNIPGNDELGSSQPPEEKFAHEGLRYFPGDSSTESHDTLSLNDNAGVSIQDGSHEADTSQILQIARELAETALHESEKASEEGTDPRMMHLANLSDQLSTNLGSLVTLAQTLFEENNRLQERIEAAESMNKEFLKKIGSLEGDLATASNTLSTKQDKIEELEGNNQTLSSELKAKRIQEAHLPKTQKLLQRRLISLYEERSELQTEVRRLKALETRLVNLKKEWDKTDAGLKFAHKTVDKLKKKHGFSVSSYTYVPKGRKIELDENEKLTIQWGFQPATQDLTPESQLNIILDSIQKSKDNGLHVTTFSATAPAHTMQYQDEHLLLTTVGTPKTPIPPSTAK